ncbi:3'-5' exonuclease [Burkholderia ambifaria]|uniref:3'-5' exonuclease n=1 Tax=Burkholderia ambifaria TaxID=152480 RepID=UPI000F80E7B0|nr:3'-5' exonuclease [Burkholderia ambifaria]
MYPNTLALARSLARTVIAYDLEHTGSAGEHRCITDFGAMRVTPAGDISSYASLVRPPKGTQFNPIVCRLTGIFPHTVEEAPGWERVLEEFVLPHQDALWVGFSSRSSDTPLVYQESRRLGHELAPFTQLDLLRVGKPLEGGLARRVAQLVPGFDTGGAHRAQKDALMTLALLEAQLPHISETELRDQLAPPPPNSMRGARRGPGPQPERAERRKMDVTQFLVPPGTNRQGQPWSEDEVLWLCRQFRDKKKAIEALAALNGRTAFAVACALCKAGLISPGERNRLKHNRT